MRKKFFICPMISFLFISILFTGVEVDNGWETVGRVEEQKLATRTFSGGDGSQDNPWQISNIEQFKLIRNNLSAYYRLKNNIQAQDTLEPGFLDPIGSPSDPFIGEFNGNGKSVTFFYMYRPTWENVSLFGVIGSGGFVHDLEISGNYRGKKNVGGIAGSLLEGGRIDECITDFEFKPSQLIDYENIGGIAGRSEGAIRNCTAGIDHEIITDTRITSIGGIVGYSCGSIQNCTTFGPMIISNPKLFAEQIGGTTGYSDGPLLEKCTSGVIMIIDVGKLEYLGGIAGRVEISTVKNCSFKGNISISTVNATSYVGGISGRSDGKVIDSIADGEIEITSEKKNIGFIGGSFGRNDGPIIDTISHSSIVIEGISNTYNIGGFLGYNSGNIQYCTSRGTMNISNSKTIWNIGGFIGDNDGESVQGCGFEGTIRISNISGNMEDVGGLIGNTNPGSISNSHSKGSLSVNEVGERAYRIGGFVGFNDMGKVECSNSEVSISMDDIEEVNHIGGFTGMGQKDGDIRDCYSVGSLRISNITQNVTTIGGLVGYNNIACDIQNCYSICDLSISNVTGGVNHIGGSIGLNYWDSIVAQCQSSGSICISDSEGGIDYCGGFTGETDHYSHLVHCKTDNTIIIDSAQQQICHIGGMVGAIRDRSIVRNSESTSIIKLNGRGNTEEIGGFSGFNNGSAYWSSSLGTVDINVSYNRTSEHVGSIGGFSGLNEVYGHFSNCISRVNISIDTNRDGLTPDKCYDVEEIGGYVGNNAGRIQTSSSSGFIEFVDEAGELITESEDHKYNISNIGGLIGYNTGPVNSSYSKSIIHAEGARNGLNIGGLIGFNKNSIKDCFYEGKVFCEKAFNISRFGGLVGSNEDGMYVNNSYSIIDLFCDEIGSSSKKLGGFMGYNKGDVANCYAIPEFAGFTPGLCDDFMPFIGNNIQGKSDGCLYSNEIGDPIDDDPTAVWINDYDLMKESATFDDNDDRDWDLISVWGILEEETLPFLYSIYHPPWIVLDHPEHAQEDSLYTIGYTLIPSDYPSVNAHCICNFSMELYSEGGLESWMDYDVSSIYGTPENDEVGTHNLRLRSMDHVGRGLKDQKIIETVRIFTFEVVNTNDPPWIMTEITDLITTALEDRTYKSYFYPADIDPVDQFLTWKVQTDASWLMNQTKYGSLLELFGTPTDIDIGNYWVNISVYDVEDAFASANFTLTVYPVNDRPRITFVPNLTAFEDEQYLLNLTASDEDIDDVLTWTLMTSPDWLIFDELNSSLQGIPTNAHVGKSYVKVKVEDNLGEMDQIEFNLTVENVNDPPFWTVFPNDQDITAGEPILLSALARDIDEGDAISYSIHSYPDSNISINPSTGVIRWLDTLHGTYDVEISAADGTTQIEKNFTIIVREKPMVKPPGNSHPIIYQIGAVTVEAGRILTVRINASDEDGDNITLSITSGPEGLVLTFEGVIFWDPDDEDVGNHTVMVSASDGRNESSMSFNVTVTPSQGGDGTDDDDPETKESSGKKDDNTFLYALLVLLVLIILILIVLLILRKKSASEEVITVTHQEFRVRDSEWEEESSPDDEDVIELPEDLDVWIIGSEQETGPEDDDITERADDLDNWTVDAGEDLDTQNTDWEGGSE